MNASAAPSIASLASAMVAAGATRQFVTVRVSDQLFGIPVEHVRDVLHPANIAPVPLAPQEVVGSLNLRGRIVTAVDARTRLGLPPAPSSIRRISVVVERKHELYSLLVDAVGDVMTLPAANCEKTPANLAPQWLEVSGGIYRLENELMILLDIQHFLQLE